MRRLCWLTAALTLASAAQAGETAGVHAGPKGNERDLPILAGGGVPFKDCSETDACPEMVVVPASRAGVVLGSPESEPFHRENEKQRTVTIAAFAVGRHEISTREYDRCVVAGACRPPEWLEKDGQHNIETGSSSYYRNYGTAVTGERQPVVGISHSDAVAYAAWLAGTTSKPYRLLSEAEWEYAARAGTTTAYWWGDDVRKDGKAWANCKGCTGSEETPRLAPIDAYSANPWGLFNVHGNVWEWVADFYCDTQDSAPGDGSARMADDCKEKDAAGLRVLRGGSAFYGAEHSRAASRLRNFQDFRNISVGFRVARPL